MGATLIFAHGLEGSPQGAKVTALRAAGFEVVAPDCQGRILAERIALVDEAVRSAVGPVLLAGSSYGGLAAAWLAMQEPRRFSGLLLCAPALGHAEKPVLRPAGLVSPPGLPVRIVHGRMDRVVPIEGSRAYRARSGPHVELVEVDDDHRLAASLDAIVAAARTLGG